MAGTILLCVLVWGIVFSKRSDESTAISDVFASTSSRLKSATGSHAPAQNSYKIIAVGDIMLDRYVETLQEQNGLDYPFEKISSFLHSADMVIANLEGPIVADHKKTAIGSMRFSFSDRIAPLLRTHNIGLVSLANNHTYDYGEDGYRYTRAALEAEKIEWVGHPQKISLEYVRSISLDSTHDSSDIGSLTIIGFHPLHGHFKISDAQQLISDIRAKEYAFTEEDRSFIVIKIHWGNEYELTSHQYQRALARALIDAGADLIIGHHPHVAQEIELYKEKIIFYSLGNFIFDQYFSKDTQESLAVGIEFDKESVSYSLYPLVSVKSQPALMIGDERNQFLTALARRSTPTLEQYIINGSMVFPR